MKHLLAWIKRTLGTNNKNTTDRVDPVGSWDLLDIPYSQYASQHDLVTMGNCHVANWPRALLNVQAPERYQSDKEPEDIFHHSSENNHLERKGYSNEWLVYTSGWYKQGVKVQYSSPRADEKNIIDARGAWTCIYRYSKDLEGCYISRRSERCGYDGNLVENDNSERSALRAVLGALQLRRWSEEGCRSLVIALDDKRVYYLITRGFWKEAQFQEPTNNLPHADLFLAIIQELARLRRSGTKVGFWLLTMQQNHSARTLVRHNFHEEGREIMSPLV